MDDETGYPHLNLEELNDMRNILGELLDETPGTIIEIWRGGPSVTTAETRVALAQVNAELARRIPHV